MRTAARLTSFEDFAVIVDAEEVGTSDVAKRYPKGVHSHRMRFNRALVRGI